MKSIPRDLTRSGIIKCFKIRRLFGEFQKCADNILLNCCIRILFICWSCFGYFLNYFLCLLRVQTDGHFSICLIAINQLKRQAMCLEKCKFSVEILVSSTERKSRLYQLKSGHKFTTYTKILNDKSNCPFQEIFQATLSCKSVSVSSRY